MSEAAKKLEGATLQKFLKLVKTHTGITMEERKREMLMSRLRPRLRALGLDTFEQYAERLDGKSSETQEFVNLVTTNETLFFRTTLVWNFFEKEFLPEWFAKNPDAQLRIWSAASSSGEEACTIAMVCEEFRVKSPSLRYRIYGTDISTNVLERAKAGFYDGRSMEEFKKKSPALLAKYFRAHETGYKLAEPLAKNMEFATHNLLMRPQKAQFFDLIFLRNVMIYFDETDQQTVLKQMHAAMKPHAPLILGESESLARYESPFDFVRPLIYRRKA